MSRTTRSITFSLPSDLAERVDAMLREQGRSRSALLREALVRYLDTERRWQETFRYGEQRAQELGLTPEDVPRLIAEHRAETQTPRTWEGLRRYGEERSRALGIGPDDVMRLIEEYRAESSTA